MILQWKKPCKVKEPCDFKCPWKGHPTPCFPVSSNFGIWGREAVSTGFLWISLYACPFSIQSELMYCSVCGITVQSSELLQWIFKQGLSRHEQWSLCSVGTAQQQWILPSPLCSSERWKSLPPIRMMVWQHSAPLRCLIAGWNKPASQLLKGKETFEDLQGSSGISRSKDYHIFAQHDASWLPFYPTCKAALQEQANSLTTTELWSGSRISAGGNEFLWFSITSLP